MPGQVSCRLGRFLASPNPKAHLLQTRAATPVPEVTIPFVNVRSRLFEMISAVRVCKPRCGSMMGEGSALLRRGPVNLAHPPPPHGVGPGP